MTSSIEAVRAALAAGPTAGAWCVMRDSDVGEYDFEVADVDRNRVVAVDGMRPHVKLGEVAVDAAFIAACNPVAIAELLATLDAAIRERDELRGDAERVDAELTDEGAWRCFFEGQASDPSCDFSRSRRGTYQNPAVARDWKWFWLGVRASEAWR